MMRCCGKSQSTQQREFVMPFDGAYTLPTAADAFLAAHNLTRSPHLARMGLRELRAFYESCAYSPTVSGVQYAVALEEPNMFGVNPEEDGMFPVTNGRRNDGYETIDEPPALAVGYARDRASLQAAQRKIAQRDNG
jgi:hypothetical protein